MKKLLLPIPLLLALLFLLVACAPAASSTAAFSNTPSSPSIPDTSLHKSPSSEQSVSAGEESLPAIRLPIPPATELDFSVDHFIEFFNSTQYASYITFPVSSYTDIQDDEVAYRVREYLLLYCLRYIEGLEEQDYHLVSIEDLQLVSAQAFGFEYDFAYILSSHTSSSETPGWLMPPGGHGLGTYGEISTENVSFDGSQVTATVPVFFWAEGAPEPEEQGTREYVFKFIGTNTLCPYQLVSVRDI